MRRKTWGLSYLSRSNSDLVRTRGPIAPETRLADRPHRRCRPPKKCNARTYTYRDRLRGISNRRTTRWPGVARTIRWGMLATPFGCRRCPRRHLEWHPKRYAAWTRVRDRSPIHQDQVGTAPGTRLTGILRTRVRSDDATRDFQVWSGGFPAPFFVSLAVRSSSSCSCDQRCRISRGLESPRSIHPTVLGSNAILLLRSPLKTICRRDILYPSGSNGFPTPQFRRGSTTP